MISPMAVEGSTEETRILPMRCRRAGRASRIRLDALPAAEIQDDEIVSLIDGEDRSASAGITRGGRARVFGAVPRRSDRSRVGANFFREQLFLSFRAVELAAGCLRVAPANRRSRHEAGHRGSTSVSCRLRRSVSAIRRAPFVWLATWPADPPFRFANSSARLRRWQSCSRIAVFLALAAIRSASLVAASFSARALWNRRATRRGRLASLGCLPQFAGLFDVQDRRRPRRA